MKHVFEALLDSDLFGEPCKDSRARTILCQRAQRRVSGAQLSIGIQLYRPAARVEPGPWPPLFLSRDHGLIKIGRHDLNLV
jgi:hypothetical protein